MIKIHGDEMNTHKYESMTFSRRRTSIHFVYKINSFELPIVNVIFLLLFRNFNVIMYLHSILIFSSILWEPSTFFNSQHIGIVQRRFLKYASFILKIDCPPHEYMIIFQYLSLNSLANRRYLASFYFLNKFLSGAFNCSFLLFKIYFVVLFCLIHFQFSIYGTNRSINYEHN